METRVQQVQQNLAAAHLQQVQQTLPAAHFNAPEANSSIHSHSIGAQNQQVAASQAHLANLKAAQARVQQLRQELEMAQMHDSPTGVAEIIPGSVKALRMAQRNQQHSHGSNSLAKAPPHTTIPIEFTNHHHHDPLGMSVAKQTSNFDIAKSSSLVETLVEDSLVKMPPGNTNVQFHQHGNNYHSHGGKVRKGKRTHGSRSRSHSRGHSPAPRGHSRGRSPAARTHKAKKNKKKHKKHKKKKKKHRQRDQSRDSSCHSDHSRSTISNVDSTRGSDPHSKAEPEFTGPPFMNPNKQRHDEDKLVIDDEEEDDQTCSAACSKDNVNLLARQLVAEAIGVYFLVTTVGLTAAQGLMLGPVAVACMVMGMIYAFGHISAAHFNPAVTLGFMVRGKLTVLRCITYIIFQFIGGGAAAAITSKVLSDPGRANNMTCVPDENFQMCGAGFPIFNTDFHLWTAFVVEGSYTFALTSMAINLNYQDYDYFFAGIANFGWIAGSGIAAGKVSGAAFNPVVGTVLPLSQGFTRDIWIYCLAPSLGGMFAGLVFRFTADPKKLAKEEHQAKYFFGKLRLASLCSSAESNEAR